MRLKCPQCGAKSIYVRSKTRDIVCFKCGETSPLPVKEKEVGK